MQFELRYQTIEPKRQTYQNIIERFGDEPATRYQEATLDIEPERTSITAPRGRPTTSCMTPGTPR